MAVFTRSPFFKIITLIVSLITVENSFGTQTDSTEFSQKENPVKVKKGWNVAPFPAVGYNTDLGFQYGVYGELYNFGDGSEYPGYFYKFCVEASRYTKGSGVMWFFFDSPHLWRKHRITFDFAWLPDDMCDFYGFNGYLAPYLPGENNSFYKIDRDQLRVLLNIQGKIVGKLNWMAGVSWQRMKIQPVSLKKYAGADNLYNQYIAAGMIEPNEAAGGNVLQWKAGIVYDSRDREADPTRGIYGEAIVAWAPDWIDQKGYSFIKTNVSLSYFQPIWKKYITLAMRASAQFTPWGQEPFYFLSNINAFYMRQTYSEGIGGICSLRGILRNRIVGNGMGWVNAEVRFRSPVFRLLKQNWYVAINPFIDGGAVLQPYRSKIQKTIENSFIYSGQKESIHLSAGIGGKLVMNDNFVLSAEYGKAFDRRDGTSSLFLGLNYLF